jgi:hypothetical protein
MKEKSNGTCLTSRHPPLEDSQPGWSTTKTGKNLTETQGAMLTSRISFSEEGTTLKARTYPLVNFYTTMENHHVSWENSLFPLGHVQ